MASRDPENIHTAKHRLDRVSVDYAAAQKIPDAKLVDTIFMTSMSWWKSCYAVLYHCVINGEGRTFMKGKCPYLGLDHDEEKEIEELRGIAIVEARFTSSDPTAYVLTQEGELYSMGCNALNQIGRNTTLVPAGQFGRVLINERILSVACGGWHCLAMTSNKVFVFGTVIGWWPMVRHAKPTEIYSGLSGNAPRQVAAGWNHGCILTEIGEILTYGDSWCGQTGHGVDLSVNTPTIVKSLKGKAVQQIGCTESGMFILSEGKLYACGKNQGSRLGLGHNKEVTKPTPIDIPKYTITAFRCSCTLVLAFTASGEAFFWGVNCGGQINRVARLAQDANFPREVLTTGENKDSAGPIYIDELSRLQRVMEELSSNMLELKIRITNREDCIDLEMPDRDENFGGEIQSMQPTHGEPVAQLKQQLHAALKSLENDWREERRRENEKYQKLLGEHIKCDVIHAENVALKADLQKLKTELNKLQLDLTESKQTIKDLGDKMDQKREENRVLKVALGASQDKVHGLEKDILALNSTLQQRQEWERKVYDIMQHPPTSPVPLQPQQGSIGSVPAAQPEHEHFILQRLNSLLQTQASMGMTPYGAHGQLHGHHQHQLLMGNTAGYRAGALPPAEDHAIRKNYPGLVNDMPANQVVDFMFAAGIINSEQMNKMISMSGEEKARMILESVRRHPKGYNTLIEALKSPQCSADWLAEQLRNDAEEYEKKGS